MMESDNTCHLTTNGKVYYVTVTLLDKLNTELHHFVGYKQNQIFSQYLEKRWSQDERLLLEENWQCFAAAANQREERQGSQFRPAASNFSLAMTADELCPG